MTLHFHFRRAVGALAVALLSICTGCATHEVKITAINRLGAATSEYDCYNIRNKSPVAADASLRYQEAARHIRTALSAKGLYEAPTAESADMIVEVDYGIAAPRVKLIEYTRTILSSPGVLDDVHSAPDAPRRVIGHQELVRSVIVREKHLSICARENKSPAENTPPAEIWRVEASIEDEATDLRGYLPILASVAMDCIGADTGGTTLATIDREGEAVQFIKKGM